MPSRQPSCVVTCIVLTRTRSNKFKIPEIIYDPTLVLSPHVFLLGMLFKVQAFKSPSIYSLEKLYSLNVLQGMNEQELPLKDEILDNFVFYQAVREAEGVRIAHNLQLSSASVRHRMKIGSQITGFKQVTKPYVLRETNALSPTAKSQMKKNLPAGSLKWKKVPNGCTAFCNCNTVQRDMTEAE